MKVQHHQNLLQIPGTPFCFYSYHILYPDSVIVCQFCCWFPLRIFNLNFCLIVNMILYDFSAISHRVCTVFSYIFAITEAHCDILVLKNGEWLLWHNMHFEKDQEAINGISLPYHLWCFPQLIEATAAFFSHEGMKVEFTWVCVYEYVQCYILKRCMNESQTKSSAYTLNTHVWIR